MATPTYLITDLFGKLLYASKPTPVYAYTSATKPLRIVQVGQLIGKLYSFIDKPDGSRWFVYEGSSGSYFYTLYMVGAIDEKKMKEQGVKTEGEKQRESENANKTILEKIFNPQNILIVATVILAGTAIKNKAWK